MRRTDAPNTKLRRRGLSLAEVLISLAITALLLVAVASAYSASAQAISTNDQFFRATQAGRVSLVQMITQLRRCGSCEVSTNRVELFTENDANIAYEYFPDSRQLKLITVDNTTDADYILARNIESIEFVADEEPDPATNINRVVRITINLVVKVDDQQIQLSSSVVPRRAVIY